MSVVVPRRLFFATQQRIAITWKLKKHQKIRSSKRRRYQKEEGFIFNEIQGLTPAELGKERRKVRSQVTLEKSSKTIFPCLVESCCICPVV
jgi:hypothetical protein